MAAFDTSFYRTPVKSVNEYRAENDAAQARQYGLKANRLSLMLEQEKLDSAHRNKERTNKLDELLRPLYAAQKSPQDIVQAMRSGGFYNEAADYEAKDLERQKTRADLDKTNAGVATERIKALKSLAGNVMSNPSPQSVQSAVQMWAQMTGADPSSLMQQVGQLQDPQQIYRWAAGFALEADKLLPKADTMDTGGAKVDRTIDPLTGRPTVVGTTAKTMTPGDVQQARDAAASRAVTMRGQNMADARAREANGAMGATKPPAGYRWTADGQSLEPIPGGPAAGAKGMTDAQAKAYLFGTRMEESDRILNDLATKGTDMPSIGRQVAEALPFGNGIAGVAANITASGEQQQVEQAQRDFINAVLRRESGAVISDQEFANARKQYFPQIGDSDSVRKQKAANRRKAIDGILAEVPATMLNKDPPKGDGGALSPAEEAELKALRERLGRK